jgi:pimeloyl-ACP methyl ester carboxylesterase
MKTAHTVGQTAAINGMEMYYEICGQGEPLLLLHGFTGSSFDWQPFINPLAEQYRLVMPDLRGHGRSTNPSMAFTHRQSALDALALLDHLRIERCRAIGVSAGGNTLLHMATQQPPRLASMVLVSASPYFPEQARVLMGEFTVDSLNDQEWRLLRQRHKHGDEQIRELWRQGNAFKDSYDDMNFTPPHLSRITTETLIVYGDRDPFYPAAIALEMRNAIPRSYLWIIPNGGHSPIFGNMIGSFVETVLPFLRGEWKSRYWPSRVPTLAMNQCLSFLFLSAPC